MNVQNQHSLEIKKTFPSSQFWNSKLAVMQITVKLVHKSMTYDKKKKFSKFLKLS